ncbi:molybdate ABC transporter permease subunit [Puia dinghuensis]|uniref:Molybdenum transport system permease n=1 Tax=Puia dinghuensis TaxID=1792502 RepID=A0A8J2UB02_9BACT|nr:molybdate ABC transporter permease subunit [Puia dinghuensis]GGA91833.1 molybdenum ABC transporter permease subunit [Puia dinghuensis]
MNEHSTIDWQPLWLSLKLASVTMLILLLVGIPLAYWLAYSRRRWKVAIEAVIGLPMVLPPSVLGFYLLLAFSPAGAFGAFLSRYLDVRLVFTFPGLVAASLIYSLPFMVNPLLAGFRELPADLKEASRTLGKSDITTLFSILLPNIRASLITGSVLSFAHTIGEFGVVMMIGGSIPGQTKVASVAIYDEVLSTNYPLANRYAIILLGFSFCILLLVNIINHYYNKHKALP